MNNELKKRFISFKIPFVISLILTVSTSVISGVVMGLFIPLISMILDQKVASNIPLLTPLMNHLETYPFDLVISLSLSIFALICLKNIICYQTLKYSQKFQLNLMSSIRSLTVKYLFQLPLAFVQKMQSGDLLLILNKHSGQTALMLEDIRLMIGSLFTVILYLYLLLTLSVPFTLLSLMCMILFYFPSKYLYNRLNKLGDISLVDARNVSVFGIEMTSGFRLIKESANEETEMTRYDNILENFNRTQLDTGLARETNRITTEILKVICIFILIISAKLLSKKYNLPLDNAHLFAFLIIFHQAIGPLASIISQIGNFAIRIAGAKDLNLFLNKADGSLQQEGRQIFDKLHNTLSFDHVSFRYEDNLDDVLNDICFEIKKGKRIAFVGESGAGKSTLLNLLYGFNRPQHGRISVDGVNLDKLNITSWRQKIACVSQDTFLFNRTIRENITYGLPEYSEPDYLKAISVSGSQQFINELPDKDNTVIGERGIRLSGGQAQRIAIARAVIKKPEILIFDEATSALDSLTERQVQNALDEVSSSFTTITIAHRLSTIIKSDVIYVLNKGKIIEKGIHNDLLKINGSYAAMWKTQSENTE